VGLLFCIAVTRGNGAGTMGGWGGGGGGWGDETTVKPELEVPKAGSITDIIIIKSNVSRNTQKM